MAATRARGNRSLSNFIEVVPKVKGPVDLDLSAALKSGDVPFARSGHRLTGNHSCLLSIGGYNPDLTDLQQSAESFYPLLRELWKFNLLRKKWSRVRTTGIMPSELASHAAVLREHFLLVSGGTGVPFGHTSSNDLHMLNLSTLSWRKLDCGGDMPQKQYGHAVTLVDESKLYMIGGTTGFQYNMDVYMLDLAQSELVWTDLSSGCRSEPDARYRHEIAHHNGKLYVFGGGTSAEVFGFDKLEVFNLDRLAWETMRTRPCLEFGFPQPRRCHAMVEYNGCVYIVGGYNGLQIFNDVCTQRNTYHSFEHKTVVEYFRKFEWANQRWTKLKKAKLPLSCFFHGAAVTPEGCLYVFGGVLDTGNKTRTNKLYRVWLTAPSLKRLAAEKLFDQYPSLMNLNPETLLNLGVPKDIVTWLHE